MGWARTFYRSANGKKVVMAVTGVILVAFIIGHVLGNLLVFRGPAAINEYGALLRANAALLWTVRVTLLGAVILHVIAAAQLVRLERLARPVRYHVRSPQVATVSSRSMRWGGVALALFVVYHILHFTTGTVHPDFEHANVYRNMVVGFRVWWASAIYIGAMIALGLHLHHGVWSVFQSLGVNHPSINPLRRHLATVVAIAVTIGFIAIPVAVLAGLLA